MEILLKLALFLMVVINCQIFSFDTRELKNSVLYKIKWPGDLSTENMTKLNNWKKFEKLSIRTRFNENYECAIPMEDESLVETKKPYNGLTAIELLKPLIDNRLCTIKIDIYWSYEICFDNYVRQFHTDVKHGEKSTSTTTYYLGTLKKSNLEKQIEELKAEELKRRKESEHKVNYMRRKKLDGRDAAYVEIKMDLGDVCDMTQQRRSTHVFYFCKQVDKPEVYIVKEIQTCYYEVIVLTNLLCTHPEFNALVRIPNDIYCYPIDSDSPKKPYDLVKRSLQAKEFKAQIATDMFHIIKQNKLEESRLGHKDDADAMKDENLSVKKFSPYEDKSKMNEETIIRFFAGKECLEGGNDFWKSRLCYGKRVEQFHFDLQTNSQTEVILLGTFDEDNHKKKLERNPWLKPQSKTLTYFYSNGDTCKKTHRSVEVKILCVPEKQNGRLSAYSMFLLEPRHCKYILLVESSYFCPYIKNADPETGIIHLNS